MMPSTSQLVPVLLASLVLFACGGGPRDAKGPEADPWAAFEMSGSLSDVSRRAMSLAERLKIQQVLREADNNKGRAAELLQITYKMLLSKVKEHRLE